MKGVVLAAGKGSRLYPITHHIPKPLLPVANKPGLEYAFERLRETGVKELCVVVGENEPAMRSALGNTVAYARQHEPKGLAHAMACARDFVGDDDFVMYLGDAVYSLPLSDAASRFARGDVANVNLVQRVPDPSRFGVANTEGERIVRLVEKPPVPESDLAMAGVYFFTRAIWDLLPSLKPSARGELEITDAIQLLVDTGALVVASTYEGKWFDTGTLDSYLACSSYLLGNGVQVASGASVVGDIGTSVCVGADAVVECASIGDATILAGSRVKCSGRIEHSIIAGNVSHDGDIVGQIVYGEES